MTPTDTPAPTADEIEELYRTQAFVALMKLKIFPARALAYAKLLDVANMVQEYQEVTTETGTGVGVLVREHIFPRADEALAAHKEAGG